jgi:RNA polymerase sigma-70 factor, ECF subfamily
MSTPSTKSVTQLLIDWRNGDPEAVDKLMPLVYDELHRLAARYMRRERSDHTLQPTALIHEAYLRLVDQRNVQWQNRAHFFAIAAQLMRRIVINHARDRAAGKRGGVARKVPLDEAIDLSGERAADLIALDDALTGLATIDPQQSRIVELRFFGGLNVEETAEILAVSPATVKREWRIAKAWLRKEITRNN